MKGPGWRPDISVFLNRTSILVTVELTNYLDCVARHPKDLPASGTCYCHVRMAKQRRLALSF